MHKAEKEQKDSSNDLMRVQVQSRPAVMLENSNLGELGAWYRSQRSEAFEVCSRLVQSSCR